MSSIEISGFQELNRAWRTKRDGRDGIWNVIITIAEARGLKGLGNHGLNDCRVKVKFSTDPSDDTNVSKIHEKTSTPFFDHVFKLTFAGQPASFFTSYVQIDLEHDRGLVFGPKLIGLLQIGMLDVFHMPDHKLPMQWFPLVDISSEEPAIPTGFVRMNVIINSLDEPGAVQSDAPELERGRTELMIIPRIHAYVTSTGRYNLIFRIYQAQDLRTMDPVWGADPYVSISCCSGEMRTDTRNGTVNPVWNQQIQLPFYEPFFRELIRLEVWHSGGGGAQLMSTVLLTFRDIVSDQESFRRPRWIDMYELPEEDLAARLLKSGVARTVARRVASSGAVRWVERKARSLAAKLPLAAAAAAAAGRPALGVYQEASVYCGRLLFSVTVEDRMAKPPSLAQTDLKPKDCKLYQGTRQRLYFRFHVFFAQGLAVDSFGLDTSVQVELSIGRKSVATKAVSMASSGLFEWYQAVELELDLLYDDAVWEWTEDDYEAGLFPSAFLDEGIPDAYIRVYRCSGVGSLLGPLGTSLRRLIGFNRCSVRELLGVGVALPDAQGRRMESLRNDNLAQDLDCADKRNIILNKVGSSQPAFYLKDADDLPAAFDPRSYVGRNKCSLDAPAWPAPRKGSPPGFPDYDDGRGNLNSLDPYIGVQDFDLERDSTCDLKDTDFPGRIWASCKVYIPSRANCESAVKGPPLLSPFTKYNAAALPEPRHMDQCLQTFSMRCHVYQARDLPSDSAAGIANAYVEVVFAGRRARTHTVYGSNSPTWDMTLWGGQLNHLELPCLGWPGWNFTHENFEVEQITYDVNADPGTKYDDAIWRRNQHMLRFVPWIEVRVMEEGGGLLGRCFVDPRRCLSTEQDPEWRELFRGNPEQDEGGLLVSIQLLHKNDPLLAAMPVELCPVRTTGAEDFLSDRARVGRIANENSKAIFMRDCRIQIQILGLRNVSPALGLRKPSVAVYVQTADCWDAEKKLCCQFTQAKEGPDPCNQNFMETLELQVQLPDDIEYAPALEFVVQSEDTGVASAIRGLFGGDPADARHTVAWGSLPLADFHPQGPEQAEDAGGADEDAEEDVAAQRRVEERARRKNFRAMIDYLLSRQIIAPEHARTLRINFESEEKRDRVIEVLNVFLEAPSEEEFLVRAEGHLIRNAVLRKATAEDDDEGGKTQAHTAAEGEEGADHAGEAATAGGAATAAAPPAEAGGAVGVPAAGQGGTLALAAAAMAAAPAEALPVEEADAGPSSSHVQAADNPQQAAAAAAAAAMAAATGGGDQGPGDQAEGAGGAAGGDKGVQQGEAVVAEDDEEADRQEEIDTPDGKPNAEWLMFRNNRLFRQPLEDTAEWRGRLADAFHEVSLFRGRVQDYKRRERSRIGILKCVVRVFRKEEADEKGRSKRSEGTKDATFYNVLASDPSMDKAIDAARPYRMPNIYEVFESTVIDVRLYCLKAVQVTPGGLRRTGSDGAPFWNHYLRCTLGGVTHESDVSDKLNPSFFYTCLFRGVTLPGPSQLVVELRDGELVDGAVGDSALVGETMLDLEDRWFCEEWKDLIYKPREVRDLINEEEQPGVSQGKLYLVLDMLDEVRAEDQPPMDIGMMGKAMQMEMRVIIWDTQDTAPKDGYTSDVYVRGELLGLGEPKMTDTHYGVKMKAPGMFNYRLKWRCRFPIDGVDFLLRLGIWDENTLTPHQCIAEGVLPLMLLFQECLEKNQGKTAPDEMEVVALPPVDDPDGAGSGGTAVGEDGAKYPYRWLTMLHPSVGFDPRRDAQAKLKISIQIQPRARARANPAGSKRNGPAKLPEPNRPPQPANPIMESEKCKAYIIYSCKECLGRCKVPCLCLLCILIIGGIIAALAGVNMALA